MQDRLISEVKSAEIWSDIEKFVCIKNFSFLFAQIMVY